MDLQFFNAINRIVHVADVNITKFGKPLGRIMDQEIDFLMLYDKLFVIIYIKY